MIKKKIESLLITLLCAVLILGVGYVGIVKGGKLLLSNKQKPEKAEFENTGSNVFYGKIEDDIQLFPWNYYGQEGASEVTPCEYYENEVLLEEVVQYMEAYCCGVEKEVIEAVYQQKQSGIINSMKAFETEYGEFFFYQDILDVEGVRYQVKLALSENSILSFSCMKYQEEDIRNTQQWEEGKTMLTKMLEQYQGNIGYQMYDMQYPYNWSFYRSGGEDLADVYIEAYIQNMINVNNMLEGWDREIESYQVRDSETIEESSILSDIRKDFKKTEEYSYQVIELKDMILMLIQGDYNMGIFFDPVRQKFCGFNYFMQ